MKYYKEGQVIHMQVRGRPRRTFCSLPQHPLPAESRAWETPASWYLGRMLLNVGGLVEWEQNSVIFFRGDYWLEIHLEAQGTSTASNYTYFLVGTNLQGRYSPQLPYAHLEHLGWPKVDSGCTSVVITPLNGWGILSLSQDHLTGCAQVKNYRWWRFSS